MFCSRSLSFFFTTLLLVSLAACRREERLAVQRLAIVSFENLSSNNNLNWAGRAIASGLVYDLAPSPEVQTQEVEGVSGALASAATEMLEGYIAERGGRLEISATLENLARSRTIASFELSGPASEGALPLLNQLAKRISAAARPFGTNKNEAFEAYGRALYKSGDPATRLSELESANFPFAGVVAAQQLLAEGRREEGLKLLTAARRGNPDAIDAAEIDYVTATVEGNTEGRARALETLTRLTPADVRWSRELAALRFAQRRFSDAARNYEAITRLVPDEADIWNQLGYAYAFLGNLTKARQALERYGKMLGSDDSNALDSLGEVSFYLGDFSAAERCFLEAQQKNAARSPEEFKKAAEARLMLGDVRGADRWEEKVRRGRADFEQAQWEFLSGRRKSAMARLEKLIAARAGDQQSVALSQLSIWKLQTGARPEAAALAEKAAASAASPRAREFAAVCRFIASGSASSSGRALVDAYALLYAGHFAEAAPKLEAAYRESNPTADGEVRTLLAWAYVETKRTAEARALVQVYPIPLSSGDPFFVSLMFPRFLAVRGAVLANAGKSEEAKNCRQLFAMYSGDVPDAFR